MIRLEEAQEHVLAHCQPLLPTELPLHEALGCVAAVAIFADSPVPPFDNSAMDGYAVRALDTKDVPAQLKVVGTINAGTPASMEVGEGQAVKIMTGAPIPRGADAIAVIETVEELHGDDEIILRNTLEPGTHIRPAGQDLAQGEMVFPVGTELTPGHLGVLASFGMEDVPVYPRPKVGVLSTGDEIIDGPGELAPGQIRDSNRHTLIALAQAYGLPTVDLGLARDNEKAIADALERGATECDVILSSGGVSMGDVDYVKKVLDRLGGEQMRWFQVAIKPAHPLAFGVVKGKPVFGLPGNPVSAMVSFEMFVFPSLRQMMGHQYPHRARVKAIAAEDLEREPDGKLHLMRVEATYNSDGRFHVKSAGGQQSNLLKVMAMANALALIPDGPSVRAGEEVDVILLTYR